MSAECPITEACEGCGASDDLDVSEADTRLGVICLTLCGRCETAGRTPAFSIPNAIRRVLAHCEHTGTSLIEPDAPEVTW